MVRAGRDMDDVYRNIPAEDIPWNIARPPVPLVVLVERGTVAPCRAIEFGCGIGNYAIYLAAQGFEVTGVDISPAAVELARRNALERGVQCRFVVADMIADPPELGDSFAFGYDWEVLHHIAFEDRERYARNVSSLLRPGALYLTVCFSERSSQFGGEGKVRETSIGTVLYFSSEDEIARLYEPYFIIDDLRTIEVAGRRGTHHAVYGLMHRREK